MEQRSCKSVLSALWGDSRCGVGGTETSCRFRYFGPGAKSHLLDLDIPGHRSGIPESDLRSPAIALTQMSIALFQVSITIAVFFLFNIVMNMRNNNLQISNNLQNYQH